MKYEIKQYDYKVTIKEPADRPSKELLDLRVQLMRKALEKMLERETNRILSNHFRMNYDVKHTDLRSKRPIFS